MFPCWLNAYTALPKNRIHLGMLCALMAAAFWLLFATYAELPVSTTHSIGALAMHALQMNAAQMLPLPRGRALSCMCHLVLYSISVYVSFGRLAAWLPVCPPARLIIIAVAVQVTCSSLSPFPFASCTHITVGGVVGFALVYGGGDAVIWAGRTSSFPYLTGVVVIVASWFISPLLAGMSATQCTAYLTSIYTVAACCQSTATQKTFQSHSDWIEG